MARRYLVVSDLHLCDIEEHADGWKAYKSARFCWDDAFDDLIVEFSARGDPGDERTLILNGDIFDFDLVATTPTKASFPISPLERLRGLKPTAEKSVWKLERVLQDHPTFVATLARFVADGHRIVYVMGNHDREFHFDAVQQALVTAVMNAASQAGHEPDPDHIRFEPWFFHVPGEIYAEHGQQYDYYNSIRYILSPVIDTHEAATLTLPMGNLSNRHLMGRMGFFNPHASDYILNVFRYLTHWLKHYAFSRRSLLFTWFFGSLSVMSQLLRTKRKVLSRPPDHDRLLTQMSDRIGLDIATVRALDQLKRLPITNRWYRVVRELWIDRIILAAIMVGGTVILALVPVAMWIKFMVPLSSFPLLFLIYEWFAHGETIFSAEAQAIGYARAVADLVPTKVVTFGHSHTPLVAPLRPGVSYVNTGTWAPVWRQNDRHELAPGLRNALRVTFDGEDTQIDLTAQ